MRGSALLPGRAAAGIIPPFDLISATVGRRIPVPGCAATKSPEASPILLQLTHGAS